jgi:hypothetical protein
VIYVTENKITTYFRLSWDERLHLTYAISLLNS